MSLKSLELIQEAERRGLELIPHQDGKHLRVRPLSRADNDLLGQLRLYKGSILFELRRREEWLLSLPAASHLLQ